MKVKEVIFLTAGLGTRMQPLTSACPKPLLPILGTPLLFIQLFILKKLLNFQKIHLNIHYLPDYFHEELKYFRSILNIEIDTYFEPSILNSGGGLANILEKGTFSEDTLFVFNGDNLFSCEEEYLETAFKQINQQRVSLLFCSDKVEYLKKYKTLAFNQNTHQLSSAQPLKTIPPHEEKQAHFFGTQLIQRQLFLRDLAKIKPVPDFSLFDFYKQIPEKITYFLVNPLWWDCGTPQDFFNLHTSIHEQVISAQETLAIQAIEVYLQQRYQISLQNCTSGSNIILSKSMQKFGISSNKFLSGLTSIERTYFGPNFDLSQYAGQAQNTSNASSSKMFIHDCIFMGANIPKEHNNGPLHFTKKIVTDSNIVDMA